MNHIPGPENLWRRRVLWIANALLRAVLWTSVSTFVAWSAGALFFHTSFPFFVRCLLFAAYLATVVFVLRRMPRRRRLSALAASIIFVYLLTLIQRPSNQREWASEQARIPSVEIDGNEIVIRNFRHAQYERQPEGRPKATVEWRDFHFQKSAIAGVSFLVQKFSPLEGLAHTFLSFRIDDKDGPRYFAVSVEIRREQHEEYSPLRGMYRQFELMYVIGDERDLIGVRTNIRKHDRVYMYPVNATPEQAQSLFLDIANRVNALNRQPQFYNTFLNNCTNSIVLHTYRLTPEPINWLDPRIVLPGYSDRFAFQQQLIGQGESSIAELRRERRIDQRAQRAGLTDTFSADIRERPAKQ